MYVVNAACVGNFTCWIGKLFVCDEETYEVLLSYKYKETIVNFANFSDYIIPTFNVCDEETLTYEVLPSYKYKETIMNFANFSDYIIPTFDFEEEVRQSSELATVPHDFILIYCW